MFIFYPLGAVLLLMFTLVQWLLSPALALAVNGDGNLPRSLKWFQTFDASVDEGWRGGYYPAPTSPLDLWWKRVMWLCRNPGYGFAYWVLGVEWEPWNTEFYFWRAPNGRDMLFFAWTEELAFDLHFRYGWLAGKFGWKFWNYFDESTQGWKMGSWGPEALVPLCFSPQLRFRK